ncbi:hypothetical protein [Streptomyces sp. NPDC048192]|jgi:hypothetical protein|uniref:hypothetical protein n=1 Tax=unclassified Streptomyces TaxID=2593676 RepID=UPI0037165F3E
MDAHSRHTDSDNRSGTEPAAGQRLEADGPLGSGAAVDAPDPRVAALRRFAAMASRRAV